MHYYFVQLCLVIIFRKFANPRRFTPNIVKSFLKTTGFQKLSYKILSKSLDTYLKIYQNLDCMSSMVFFTYSPKRKEQRSILTESIVIKK